MEPQPPGGMGFAVPGQPIWVPNLGPQGGMMMHLPPGASAALGEGEHGQMQAPMGMPVVQSHPQQRFDGFQLPDGQYVVHQPLSDAGHVGVPSQRDMFAQQLVHGRAMAMSPQQAVREEALARCKRLFDVISAKEGASIIGESPGPAVPGLREIGARLNGWAPPYVHLPAEFVADMRRLWVQRRVAHGEASNLGRLAHLMHAIFERLSREWVTGDIEGRPPIPVGYVLRADDDMCSACGRDTDRERMAMCEACDRRVHIHCMRPPLLEMPDVRARPLSPRPRARGEPASFLWHRRVCVCG